MDQLKFYRIATVALLVLNVAMVAFFLLAPPPGAGPAPGKSAREKLQLDGGQHDAFLSLAEEHKQLMRQTNQEQRQLLATYFGQLAGETADQNPRPPQEVFTLAERKITSTYEHLLDVKGLLRPDQLDKYPDFVQLALGRILGEGKATKPRE